MVLKSTLQVGLRRVAGVSSFGEEAEIGQPEACHQLGFPGHSLGTQGTLPGGIDKSHEEQQGCQTKEGQSTMGRSHKNGRSCART